MLVPKKGQYEIETDPVTGKQTKRQRLRVCQDYRNLNKRIRKLAYTGMTCQEMFDYLSGATIFSTWDLSGGA